MTVKTITALKSSIRKWYMILNNEAVDQGEENCALCHRFSASTCTLDDEVCPAARVTVSSESSEPGEVLGCILNPDNPYGSWNAHQRYKHNRGPYEAYYIVEGCSECTKRASQMYLFLLSKLQNELKTEFEFDEIL